MTNNTLDDQPDNQYLSHNLSSDDCRQIFVKLKKINKWKVNASSSQAIVRLTCGNLPTTVITVIVLQSRVCGDGKCDWKSSKSLRWQSLPIVWRRQELKCCFFSKETDVCQHRGLNLVSLAQGLLKYLPFLPAVKEECWQLFKG